MAEYIERESLIEYYQERFEFLKNKSETKVLGGYMIDEAIQTGAIIAKEFLDRARNAPTADVQEVKHGEWIKNKPNIEAMQEFHKQGIAKAISKRSIYWTCSCCGSWGTPAYRYCQNCGAKIDKE